MLSSRPYTFDRVIRIVFSAIIIIGIFWLLKILYNALLPFFIACLLAYMFKPFVEFNKKLLRCKRNIIPIILFLIELCVALTLIVLLVLPSIIEESVVVANLFKDYATSNDSPFLPQAVHDFIRENIDLEYLSSLLTREQWIEIIKRGIDGTWTVVSGSISVILTIAGWFIVLLYFIFILMDYDRFVTGIRQLVPQKYKKTVFGIANDVKDSMNCYFRGQATVAFLVGILFSIGFLIIDMPMAIVLGLFIGVLNLVPYLQLISQLPNSLLCIVYAAETGTRFWWMFAQAMID